MSKSDSSDLNTLKTGSPRGLPAREPSAPMTAMSANPGGAPHRPPASGELLRVLAYLEECTNELESTDLQDPNPVFRMSLHAVKRHLEGKVMTPTSLIAASNVPYATGNRRLRDMIEAGLIDQRPRTKSGKRYSMHPSEKLLAQWAQMAGQVGKLAATYFSDQRSREEARDYYFGSSYMTARTIPPIQVLSEPLKLAGGMRVLVHGDPTFMVMETFKRQFEQVVGTQIHQRAYSIDRLRAEALRNAGRKSSRYDIIALDLPWIGEFAEKNVLIPLDEVMSVEGLAPADFHTAGWKATHWDGRPYGVPAQTTPELLLYRRDLFASAGLEPPATTDQLLVAAREMHAPQKGRYGIAWNGARGTALGHTVLMTMADFGQPVLDLPESAGGYETDGLAKRDYRVTIDTERGLMAAEHLIKLLEYSPPETLTMSWYERMRSYAEGRVAMAYGYTLLAPYFELDPASPAHGQTGYLPHPSGPGALNVAPVGGYAMGIPANLPPERAAEAVKALRVFTSPEAQKLYIQNGSRTSPRFSVGADAEVRRTSPIFEVMEAMSWRDELQFWPRPPVPEITGIIQVCGEEFHDMLRGRASARTALRQAQERADALINQSD